MKKYNITVNGTTYEVIVEEVDGSVSHAPVYTAPVSPVSAPVAPKAAAVANVGGANKVVAPMPGTILAVNKQPGSAVAAGDVILILEAMKMENEIVAPCAGTLTQVLVSKGSTVDTDAVLAVIG